LSTAAQKVAEAQETESRKAFGFTLGFGSIKTGADQEVPFQVSALPKSSTATQKFAEGQETEKRPPFGSIGTGADQEVPFQVSA
jgi:hypothetical protein